MRRHERRGSRTRGSPRQMSVRTKAVVLVLAAGFMGLLVGVAVSDLCKGICKRYATLRYLSLSD
jgi:hypothetical protein